MSLELEQINMEIHAMMIGMEGRATFGERLETPAKNRISQQVNDRLLPRTACCSVHLCSTSPLPPPTITAPSGRLFRDH